MYKCRDCKFISYYDNDDWFGDVCTVEEWTHSETREEREACEEFILREGRYNG